ncbi:MAG: HAD-IIIC family phosphatase [Candidatus Heimdallarchaeota archaeon]|nr:HAD-IIIC family phosphatase [Candidatus Heimdallarchaeota archaeon]MCK4954256.1 HAD-IIIC family phosphatase [Candidatus Heimdallarchaeota archaeon]
MSLKRILSILKRMITDKRFRNTVLTRLTQEVRQASQPINIATKLSDKDQEFLAPMKIAFVGGCELEFMKEFFEANGASCYLTFDHNESSDPNLTLSDFKSGVYSFNPDIVIISDVQFIRNEIGSIQHNVSTFESQEEKLQFIRKRLLNGIQKARTKLNATYVIMTYPLVIRPAFGRFDYKNLNNSFSLREFLNRLELSFYDLSKQEDDVYVLSVNESFLKAGVGLQIRENDADGVYEHFTREGAVTISLELLNHLRVVKGHGRRIKCVVVDLDNTLWDGILRDDGVEGISVYHNRLTVLEFLTQRGILLAIASKNDSTIQPLVDKVLGRISESIVVKKINWNDKAQNLVEIAQELNIGLDSLAFFDDNPYERDQIELFLPDVLVLPETDMIHTLNRIEFEPLGKLTKESTKRTQMYAEHKKREIDENEFALDKEGFLHSCDLELWMREAKDENLGRVTELIQRTNQLNATAVRYSKDEILQFHKSTEYKIYVVNLYDKYGEYGLIGVTVIHKEEDKWVMEVLTFSCRAMGKTVEQTFLSFLMQEAQKENANSLVGKYRKTERNEAMERLFTEAEFESVTAENRLVIWKYNFEEKEIPVYPTWFRILKREK